MTAFEREGRDSAWRVAARYGDAAAGERGVLEALDEQGIDAGEFRHIADQRALRVVLMQRPGWHPSHMSDTEPTPVRLDPLETAAHIIFQSCYFDGLYIGWRARGLSDGPAANSATLPRDLLARLMAAVETPDDLTDEDRTALLEDCRSWEGWEADPADADEFVCDVCGETWDIEDSTRRPDGSLVCPRHEERSRR